MTMPASFLRKGTMALMAGLIAFTAVEISVPGQAEALSISRKAFRQYQEEVRAYNTCIGDALRRAGRIKANRAKTGDLTKSVRKISPKGGVPKVVLKDLSWTDCRKPVRAIEALNRIYCWPKSTKRCSPRIKYCNGKGSCRKVMVKRGGKLEAE
ncbi:MAG: hypothetical protein ABJN26_15670 [Stappiaceae bacterium]